MKNPKKNKKNKKIHKHTAPRSRIRQIRRRTHVHRASLYSQSLYGTMEPHCRGSIYEKARSDPATHLREPCPCKPQSRSFHDTCWGWLLHDKATFEYFPELPIYHSKDFLNWKLVGHA
jgi:hypothetical protein